MMVLYKNNKSGAVYSVVNMDVINSTNNRDGEKMVLYICTKSGLMFVREQMEFLKKFTKYDKPVYTGTSDKPIL